MLPGPRGAKPCAHLYPRTTAGLQLLSCPALIPVCPAARVFRDLFQSASSAVIVDEEGVQRRCTIQVSQSVGGCCSSERGPRQHVGAALLPLPMHLQGLLVVQALAALGQQGVAWLALSSC